MSCFNQVGGFEVATTEERLAELKRRSATRPRGVSMASACSMRAECQRALPDHQRGRLLAASTCPATAWHSGPRIQLLIERTAAAGVSTSGRRRSPESSSPRPGDRCSHPERHYSGRHCRFLRRLLGRQGWRDDRHVSPAAAVGPPVREDHSVPAQKGRNDCPTAPRCRSCATRTRTCTTASTVTVTASVTTRHRPMPVDVVGWALRPQRTWTSSTCPRASTSPWRTSLPAWEPSQAAAAGPPRERDRGRLQRHLLLHPGRRTGRRSVPGRRRLLRRRSSVGHPLGRHRARRRGGADQRQVAD